MHHFSYQNGQLYCEQVDLSSMAQTYETPLYVYSAQTILDNYSRLDQALSPLPHEVAYAVKANSNLSILKLLAEAGSGFDIVSGGELYRVIEAGGDPSKCTFAGVGKTREEIRYALKAGIYCFNVESEDELLFINEVAKESDCSAPIALRVNPNVDAKTHKYISTGTSENKFGIDFELIPQIYKQASQLSHIQVKGLQMHIGSQLTSLQPFVDAVQKVAPLASKLKEQYQIEFFSIGGGIGIIYEEALASGSKEWWDSFPPENRPLTPEAYAEALIPLLESTGLRIFLEPGRFISGNAGVLLTRCLYEKHGRSKTFKIVDSGMHHLIRPALYEGHHQILPLRETPEQETIDIVGPICESGDFFCQNRSVPKFTSGDVIALMSAGAYGATMASTYNTHPLPAEVMIQGESVTLIRRRQTLEELLEAERC